MEATTFLKVILSGVEFESPRKEEDSKASENSSDMHYFLLNSSRYLVKELEDTPSILSSLLNPMTGMVRQSQKSLVMKSLTDHSSPI